MVSESPNQPKSDPVVQELRFNLLLVSISASRNFPNNNNPISRCMCTSLNQFRGVYTLPEFPVIPGFWYTQRPKVLKFQQFRLQLYASQSRSGLTDAPAHIRKKRKTVDRGGNLSHNLWIGAQEHATRRFWSCQSVCQCISLSRKHHVPGCQVLPTKHNSPVALSGCHFTKPGRLGEITSICGKTNGRWERTAWDTTSRPGWARTRRSPVFGRPSKPLQPSCCHLRPSPCNYLLSPRTSVHPPSLRHAAIVRV